MSHGPPHDPTPTPSSKPEETELIEVGERYAEGYEQGYEFGYTTAKELEPHFTAEAVNAALAAAPRLSDLVLNYETGDPKGSGYRDGYRFGFLRGIQALWLGHPTAGTSAVKDAVETQFKT